MKLLFDQNLSPGLVTKLAGHYPDSAHAASVSNAFVGAALARENRELVSDPIDPFYSLTRKQKV